VCNTTGPPARNVSGRCPPYGGGVIPARMCIRLYVLPSRPPARDTSARIPQGGGGGFTPARGNCV